MSKTLSRRLPLLAMLLAGSALSGAALLARADAATATPVTPPTSSARMPDFADLVARVKPAVVSITVKMQPVADTGENLMPFGPFGPMQPEHRRPVEARGSGFIVDAGGTVVTNNHVVKDAKSVSIMLDDGTELPARVIGHDTRTDLAVLKITAPGKSFPFIQMGDSASVRPGEWVVAMGNPFGLGGTVTAGIVSAKGRDIGSGPYDQFIQIDAPINQGNSGGPLFNQDGKVVGVNSAIFSPSGGSVGIGFAIPADVVKTVVAELEKSGHITRGYAGVEMQPIDPSMAKALKLSGDEGALVAGVVSDGPAAKAGVQPGDVIRAVNGQAVKSPRDLAMDIGAARPGDSVTLDLIRNGSTEAVKLQLVEMPGEHKQAGAASADSRQGKIGLALAPLTPELRERLDLAKTVKGAVVGAVQPGSPGETAGIRPGDVVIGVGSKAVTSPEEAVRAIHGASKDENVALRILRDGKTAFVAVDLKPADSGKG